MKFKKGDIIQCTGSIFSFTTSQLNLYFKIIKEPAQSLLEVKSLSNAFKGMRRLNTNTYTFKKVSDFEYTTLKLKGIVI